MNDLTKLNNSQIEKWNVVYNVTVAGTVSQEQIDLIKTELQNPKIPKGMHMIWNIELTKNSTDKEVAEYLMLIGEFIEKEDLEMNIEDCEKL